MNMGGFLFFDGDIPRQNPSYEEVETLVANGTLVAPLEDEIWSLSKGGWFSKTFALLQTLWFTTQCIARRIQHLPLTELEVITLSYALMTAGMYLFWWKKPLRVDRPYPIQTQSDG